MVERDLNEGAGTEGGRGEEGHAPREWLQERPLFLQTSPVLTLDGTCVVKGYVRKRPQRRRRNQERARGGGPRVAGSEREGPRRSPHHTWMASLWWSNYHWRGLNATWIRVSTKLPAGAVGDSWSSSDVNLKKSYGGEGHAPREVRAQVYVVLLPTPGVLSVEC